MTIKDLKEIIFNAPEDAIVILETEEICDLESVSIQYHSDGKVHVILSKDE